MAGTVRWVAAALIALPLAGGLAVQPALAEAEDPPVDFVCFDVVDGEGNEDILCEPADLVAEECRLTGADGPECDAAEAQIRPARTWDVPLSLSEGSDSDPGHGGGSGGSGGVKMPRQPNHF